MNVLIVLMLFIGFMIGIVTMAMLISSGQAEERERAQRNNERLARVARWYYGKRNEDPVKFINKFPKKILEEWANDG